MINLRLLPYFLLFICTINFSYGLSEEDARHFLARTGENLSEQNLSLLSNKSRDEAFSWLLRHHAEESNFSFHPHWLKTYDAYYEVFKNYPTNKDSRAYREQLSQVGLALQASLAEAGFGSKKLAFDVDKPQTFDIDVHKIVDITGHILNILWMERIIKTKSPFTETMTLFWHGHFTSSFNKVQLPDLMLTQNFTLRKNSLGTFSDLLFKMTTDKAMLIYLDGQDNVKGKPNLNYARELLELFTLGEGRYSEQDIREVARALTGLNLNGFDPSSHDEGEKTILNHTGYFNYKHVLSLLLRLDLTSQLIVSKLWRAFISPTPDETQVKKWAVEFKSNAYDIQKLMQRMLTSDQFYSPNNRLSLIRSPVEFIISPFVQFSYTPENYMRMVHQTRVLGQTLYRPPDVRGWLGGKQWITLSTWLIRQRHVKNMFLLNEGTQSKGNAIDFSPSSNRISDSVLAKWKSQFKDENWRPRASFLLIGKKFDTKENLTDREFLAEIMSTPEYSLK